MKKCNKCGEIKPLSEFPKCKGNPDGHNYTCKQCGRELQKKYYMENQEEQKRIKLERYYKKRGNTKSHAEIQDEQNIELLKQYFNKNGNKQ